MSNRFNINTCSATFEFLFTIYVCNNDFKYIASLELSVPERYSMHMINPYNKFWKAGGYFLIHSTPVFSIGLWWDPCCSYVLGCAVVFVFVLCLVLNVVLVCGLTTRFLSCAQCCPSMWIDYSVSLLCSMLSWYLDWPLGFSNFYFMLEIRLRRGETNHYTINSGDPNSKPKQNIALLKIFQYILNANSSILNPFIVVVANIETSFSYKSNRFNIKIYSIGFSLMLERNIISG